MDEFDKLRITRNLPFLKEQLSDMIDLGPIMDELVSRHIWTYERRNDVAGSPEKCEKFIKCLIRSTPTAYREFIDILVKNNKKYIADRLQNTKIGDKDSTAESPASDERTKPTPEVKIVSKTENTMDEYMKKFENMIGKISDNNEKCSRKLEDKIDCLKLETKKGKEAISGLTNEMNCMRIEHKDTYEWFRTSLSNTKKQLAEQRQRNSYQRQEIIGLQEKAAEMESDMQNNERRSLDEINQIRMELEEKLQQIIKLECQNESLQSEKDELEEKKQLDAEARDESDKLNNELQEKLDDKELEVKNLSSKGKTSQREHDRITKNLEDEIQTPEVKIVSKTESTMDEYMKKFESAMDTKMENMIGKICDNHKKCSRKLKKKIECFELERKKEQEAIFGLTNEMKLMRIEHKDTYERFCISLSYTKQQLTQQRQRNSYQRQEIIGLQKKAAKMESDMQKNERRSSDEINQIRMELEEKLQQIIKLECQNESLQSEKDELEEKKQLDTETRDEVNNELQEKLDDKELEVKNLSSKGKTSQREHDRITKNLEDEIQVNNGT